MHRLDDIVAVWVGEKLGKVLTSYQFLRNIHELHPVRLREALLDDVAPVLVPRQYMVSPAEVQQGIIG